jgi:hypothetical protein
MAYLLSVAAGWAYSDAETFAEVMVRIGVADAECRLIAVENDAMLYITGHSLGGAMAAQVGGGEQGAGPTSQMGRSVTLPG